MATMPNGLTTGSGDVQEHDEQTFADRHAQVDPDPVVEIERRLRFWASAPGEDGAALKPDASIVPDETLIAALAELKEWRKIGAAISKAKTRGNA